MIVISDTTPIITLLKINHLDLLQRIFNEVHIPTAVYNELTINNLYEKEAEIIKNCEFIKHTSVNNLQSVILLQRATGLDLGESEAIILSDEYKNNLLLIDEFKGRQIAKSMGISIMGTIGILTLAYEDGLLNKQEILTSIEIMKNKGRHISEKLYEQLLKKIGE